MKRNRKKALSCIAALLLALFAFTACGPVAESDNQSQTAENTSSASDTTSGQTSQPEQEQEATLYIGTGQDFTTHSLSYTGTLTPEVLIDGIASLTGWNLDLADAVTTRKDGATVSFAKTSSIFTGPPDPQKEEFFVHDTDTLVSTILDSVKKTLQNNLVDISAGGDPDAFPVYYSTEGDQPITIDDLNLTIPIDQPYTELADYLPSTT